MKDTCGLHDEAWWKKLISVRILIVAVTVVTITGSSVLIVWLILRPTVPHFVLQDVTVNSFDVSPTNLLTSNFQITLYSRNPNGRIGIYYDKVRVSVSYRGQRISLDREVPCFYQGHKDATAWAPSFSDAVQVSPYFSDCLNRDRMAGTLLINFRVDARIRWKVGSFVTGTYHLKVNCPAYLDLDNRNNGIAVGNAIKFQLIMDCHVDV